MYCSKIKLIENRNEKWSKGKIEIGKYSGAWNYFSTKREAMKSYALVREG